jgi:glycosyltransferase involved in cell wall biosynthesis
MGHHGKSSHRSDLGMRVALIHYWLINCRGGEKTLRAIADLFPGADIYAHVVDPEVAARDFRDHKVATTFIGRLPFGRTLYQKYLPLMPLALEQLDLREYDLVISSESGPAKGVIVAPHTTHICYCHSPMRYVWDMYHEYTKRSGLLTRLAMTPLLHRLRLWDQVSAQRVDDYVANSNFVAVRINKYYRRRATVIHPPVAVDEFSISNVTEDFYLSVGQLVAYKRAELLVDAFNASGKQLTIIGEGELLPKLRKMAKPNIRLLGWQPSDVIRDHYRRCRAVLLPGVEDFGIVPVEAMACGKPVIAFGYGGALETVIDGVSGVLFSESSAAGLNQAIGKFESAYDRFDAAAIRRHSEQFSTASFKNQFRAHVDSVIADEDAMKLSKAK